MDGDTAVRAIYLVGFLALVASAFASRRIPASSMIRMAVMWLAIFGAAFLIAKAMGY